MMKKGILLMTLLITIMGSSLSATINAEGVSSVTSYSPFSHGVDH